MCGPEREQTACTHQAPPAEEQAANGFEWLVGLLRLVAQAGQYQGFAQAFEAEFARRLSEMSGEAQ